MYITLSKPRFERHSVDSFNNNMQSDIIGFHRWCFPRKGGITSTFVAGMSRSCTLDTATLEAELERTKYQRHQIIFTERKDKLVDSHERMSKLIATKVSKEMVVVKRQQRRVSNESISKQPY